MALRDKIFLDTNVALDHLADRQPFAESAHRIFGLAEQGKIIVCIASLTFSNLYYILRKLKGHEEALGLLRKLKSLVRIAAVAEPEIDAALRSDFKDFEDAIQHYGAKAEGEIKAIVTRNKDDFKQSEIIVVSPEEFLAGQEKLESATD